MEINTSAESIVEESNVSDVDTNSAATSSPAEPEGLTYSAAEVARLTQRAVDSALKKAREKATKSNDELTQELNELKAQLAAKENISYVASQVNKLGLPAELSELFYGESEDVSNDKITKFSKWYKTAVDNAVEARLNATPTPTFNSSQPGIDSAKKPLGTFAQWLGQ